MMKSRTRESSLLRPNENAAMFSLGHDEKALLKLRQADRPSIYKVLELSGDHQTPGIFLLQDMLSPSDSIR